MHTVLVGAASGKKSAYRQKDYVNMMMDGQVQRVPASRMELDVCGHYARPDVLRLTVQDA